MTYRFVREDGVASHDQLEPLYRAHYAEMAERLAAQGVAVPPYGPRLEVYFDYMAKGHILTFVVRTETTEPVGYCNLYLTNDMHNGESIATEDTIFVRKDHRNGVGRLFSKAILAELKTRGVKRLNVTALTDLRVAKLWKRMGFKEVGTAMTYEF